MTKKKATKRATPRRKSPVRRAASSTADIRVTADARLEARLESLAPTHRADVDAVRAVMRKVAPGVVEEFKWNAPSYRCATFFGNEFFATVHLRDPSDVQVILHSGVRSKASVSIDVPDPKRLVRVLAPDRRLVALGCGAQLRSNRTALTAIVRAWLRQG